MKKRTRSILDELRNIGRVNDAEAFIETTGSNIIESAVNLLNTIRENYPEDQAQELERRFLNSIRNKEAKKFQVGVKKIIESKKHNLPSAKNELFGPILSVMKFDTEEEAIKQMNDNKYGLSSGIYTSNLGRGMRVSKAVRAGITFVNTYRLISPMAPFGGIKDSGYGKEAGIESIKEYTRIKTTWYNSSDKPMTDPFTMG